MTGPRNKCIKEKETKSSGYTRFHGWEDGEDPTGKHRMTQKNIDILKPSEQEGGD